MVNGGHYIKLSPSRLLCFFFFLVPGTVCHLKNMLQHLQGQSGASVNLHPVLLLLLLLHVSFSPPLLQVRKEYGKCLRTHCCSGKSVETSISSSSKTTTSRTPGRYSTGSQVSLPACTPGRYSTADSQVRPERAMRVLGYPCSLSK